MAISNTLQHYLNERHVNYDVIEHAFSCSSSETAEAAHIPGSRLVKAIVVKCQDTFKLALLPASHHLRLKKLQDVLDQKVELASENDLTSIFGDCSQGAVPAMGMAYGLDVIVDTSLHDVGDLFFEGGDHKTLVHIESDTFEDLLAEAPHGSFSRFDRHPENRSGYRFSHS